MKKIRSYVGYVIILILLAACKDNKDNKSVTIDGVEVTRDRIIQEIDSLLEEEIEYQKWVSKKKKPLIASLRKERKWIKSIREYFELWKYTNQKLEVMRDSSLALFDGKKHTALISYIQPLILADGSNEWSDIAELNYDMNYGLNILLNCSSCDYSSYEQSELLPRKLRQDSLFDKYLKETSMVLKVMDSLNPEAIPQSFNHAFIQTLFKDYIDKIIFTELAYKELLQWKDVNFVENKYVTPGPLKTSLNPNEKLTIPKNIPVEEKIRGCLSHTFHLEYKKGILRDPSSSRYRVEYTTRSNAIVDLDLTELVNAESKIEHKLIQLVNNTP